MRWCLRCYEPAREFSPRPPLHRGDFVDTPHHFGGHVPHWSRWEKGATTFGPMGRVLATAVILGGVLAAPGAFAIAAVIGVPVLLRDIWKKDWVVPDEPEAGPLPLTSREVEDDLASRTTAQQLFRWIGWVFLVGLGATFAYGPISAKGAALAAATIISFVWFLRGFLSR